MLDFLKKNNEDKKADENRINEQNFIRERDTFKESSVDDQFYLAEKKDRSDLIRWQQDLEDEVEKLKHLLRSEYFFNNKWNKNKIKTYNKELKTYVIVDCPPLANDLFISYLETQIVPFLSRSLTNSNLDEKRILSILKNTCDDLADSMSDNYDKYGIDFENYDLIMRMVKNVIIPAAYKSCKGWTKNTDSTMIKRIEAINEQSNMLNNQKRGLFKVFN